MTIALDAATETYLRHVTIERGLSQHTVGAYRRDLTTFRDWLATTSPVAVDGAARAGGAAAVDDVGLLARADVAGFVAHLTTRPEGPLAPRSVARMMLADYGWGDGQFSCLNSLWTKESSWDYTATNAGSGAYGIPQSLPASKMASVGADYRTNPVTQITWGLQYIKSSYGSPCSAWGHSQATNWY